MRALIADGVTSETGKCTMIIIVKFQVSGNLSAFCNPSMKKITKFKDILNRFLDCRLKNFSKQAFVSYIQKYCNEVNLKEHKLKNQLLLSLSISVRN